MAKTKKQSKSHGADLLENPDAIVSRTEEFFTDKKNQTLVFGIGGAIALLVAAFMAYTYYINSRNDEAQIEMFQAIYFFEADSLGKALNGDGNNFGFLDIADIYAGTDAANISSFYAGAIYMRLGDYENAIRYLDDFSSSDMLVQARAYSLIGDANMELDDFAAAVKAYKKASNYKENKEFTPIYLGKLALAYEKQGKYADAAAAYDKIVTDFVTSSYYQEALKQKARLEGLALN